MAVELAVGSSIDLKDPEGQPRGMAAGAAGVAATAAAAAVVAEEGDGKAASAAAGKRPGASLKEAMPGKKRLRQTVLLEDGEGVRQARPLRHLPPQTPSQSVRGAEGRGGGGGGRRGGGNSLASLQQQQQQAMNRRDLLQQEEEDEAEAEEAREARRRGTGGEVSAGAERASVDDSNGELPAKLGGRILSHQLSEGGGRHRRPVLKRQSSAVALSRDCNRGGGGGDGSNRTVIEESRLLGGGGGGGEGSKRTITEEPRLLGGRGGGGGGGGEGSKKTAPEEPRLLGGRGGGGGGGEGSNRKVTEEPRLLGGSVPENPEIRQPRRIAQPKGGGKRQAAAQGTVVQDASIERLHREATCSKLWQTGGAADLQRVPDRFESVEEYVRVLEPLLFEECRAQLRSAWEELLEGSVQGSHIPVVVKGVERRERGWWDVVVLPQTPPAKFRFKEGDVAVLSTPRPGWAGGRYHSKGGRTGMGRGGSSFKGGGSFKERDRVATGRITGIVRRYYPIDVRDPMGAALHFHVVPQEEGTAESQLEDPASTNLIAMRGLDQPQLTWYLTVLGGVTTTQREYVALHFLQQFHPRMLNAVLQPRPELFPGYAEQEPPSMPEGFTPAFVQHLHECFNGPQLAAIQWAGAHTAAGSIGAGAGGAKQEPWPFTLVQGPPGTGKTHTVWGMLNAIHLVQYQRYYQALLQKLAPSSVASEEPLSSGQGSFENGSIDHVLQRMDDSLARMLPKLCPKPRMLVCAPSNAATDELLSRVLDRGFIDGEMRVYRPDVARVGSDSHSRAAEAVSVERRSEQLLAMDREQVMGWLHMLKTKEVNCSQMITALQRDLNAMAATSRAHGNLGIDPETFAARDQVRDTKLQQLAALVEERDKILVEMSRLLIVEGMFRPVNGFTEDDARQKLEASFANEAEIVFTTVSSSGRRIFTKLTHGFDMVVIDEAAQASEVAVLPPLSLRAARCVLVGDPQQLPATVISKVADTMQYSRSLFERFQHAGCPAILLSVQYRMHPQIRDFPSRHFYQGRLVDSESVKGRSDEVYHKDRLLQPYLFYDISEGRESHGGSVSYQNRLEAQVAVRLYLHLQKAIAAGSIPNTSVGIITPYKQQLRCLQTEFESLVGTNANSKGVYINTVDSFQGQERDVIMMSCVRASTHGVGFVADIRRMNVALTRARRSLWVIGNATALQRSDDWAALLADARQRACIVETSTCVAHGLLPAG